MTISFLQATTDTTDTNAYTFASQNLGTAASDRYIIVVAVARKGGASTTLSSVTIGGVSATIVKQVTNNVSNTDVAGIAIAAVPTGTTGDIVVTWGASMVRCAIMAYRATGINATAYDSDSSTSGNPSVSLDIPASGFAIGGGLTAASTTTSWTGLTEDTDGTLESFVTYSSAHDEFPSGETGRTITMTFGSSTESAGVFASWGPAVSTNPKTLNNFQFIEVGNGMSASERIK